MLCTKRVCMNSFCSNKVNKSNCDGNLNGKLELVVGLTQPRERASILLELVFECFCLHWTVQFLGFLKIYKIRVR